LEVWIVEVAIMDLANLGKKRYLLWVIKAIKIALMLAGRSKPAAIIFCLCAVRNVGVDD
jgi:hypothetical protein